MIVDPDAQRFAFILLDGYALMSVASAVEPLRAANLLAGRTLYDLTFLSVSDTKVRSSVGSWFDTTALSEAGADFDIVFVVAGGDPLIFRDDHLLGFLRRLSSRGVALGGVSGGAAILHVAGLLRDRRFTIHWRHFDALKVQAPDAMVERRLFVIDRDRFTCAGGASALDMMHALIAKQHGAKLAGEISEWFIHTGVRIAEAPQQLDAAVKYGVRHPALVAMVNLMNDHIADPMALNRLARLSGVGERQLERLCKSQVGLSVVRFYRQLRLSKAKELLTQTALPISQVALATGFTNVAHFSREFRAMFNQSPSEMRRGQFGRGVIND